MDIATMSFSLAYNLSASPSVTATIHPLFESFLVNTDFVFPDLVLGHLSFCKKTWKEAAKKCQKRTYAAKAATLFPSARDAC
jgi:hypothetical protein